MKVGKKSKYPQKTLTTSFRKCHILKTENSSPNRNSNQQTITSRVDGEFKSWFFFLFFFLDIFYWPSDDELKKMPHTNFLKKKKKN